MENNYGDIDEAGYNLSEITKFIQEKNIDQGTEEKLIDCMLIGYKAVDTTSLYNLATALNMTIDSIWKEEFRLDNSAYIENISIYNDEEKEYLKRLNTKEALDIRKIVQYCMDNNISPLYLKEQVKQYDMMRLEQEQNIRPLNSTPVENFDEDTFNKYFTTPFSVDANEGVSESTGNLSLSDTEFTLEGRNGLDLNIGTVYNSIDSNLYNHDVDYNTYSNKSYKVDYSVYKKNEYTGVTVHERKDSRNFSSSNFVDEFLQDLSEECGIIETNYEARVFF